MSIITYSGSLKITMTQQDILFLHRMKKIYYIYNFDERTTVLLDEAFINANTRAEWTAYYNPASLNKKIYVVHNEHETAT